ncbi:hypothetical protein BN7_1608 [Wickerhamomyces ciferrii]|uniref:Uncharacterized protein n=1 Tax=Wickerhamomyces ciferrii (strain ATCC 14091 / BCRC 22168 / CBS 111 / JCM 3599 / NBRC 0793 / NRRL Y-1031 F-60-10) TaxID=1206466 RepID=K0KKS2_WICCF|nr:uncharacterized protein BN7_1608 [Wickerhamomyces ciferrii]CCH42069.1 hypothetical protein BN7_1608 [Wickerhamomyces ciferrii]
MNQSFDPLSFFTPQDVKNDAPYMTTSTTISTTTTEPTIKVESLNIIIAESSTKTNSNVTDNEKIDDEEEEVDEDLIIHVLDLPYLTKNLPVEVLITILKLLKPEEETNFGSNGVHTDDSRTLEEILEFKEISKDEYFSSKDWLNLNGYSKLAKNLCHIHFSSNFFQYLNKILSSSFASNDTVLMLASLRISENCGRTARPNFQRKILLKDFDKSINLFEPALTSDNLGLKTWGSSLILSELIVEEHNDLILEPVLELGSGTGLCGITINLLGYNDVILTDLPEILPNLSKNIELNECSAQCEVLDWTNPSSFLNKRGDDIKFNTIVIADPIYSSDHPTWVVNMMSKFLAQNKDARILLQIPIRKTFEKERSKLWSLLQEHRFSILNERIIDGYDDFGAQKFIYKELRWSNL